MKSAVYYIDNNSLLKSSACVLVVDLYVGLVVDLYVGLVVVLYVGLVVDLYAKL